MALNWLTLLVYVELPGPNWSKIQTVRNFHWISIFRFLQTCREYQMLAWKCQSISKVMLVSSWRNIRAWAYYKIASFSTLTKFGSGFCHADCFHGNGNKPSIFVRESQKVENKQVWFECHIIKYLSTSIARAVLDNIGPVSFVYGPCWVLSVLPQPRANIPYYSPHVQLVRSSY